MKNWWQDIKTYYKNNPEGYWFKRKLYGWGWTPVRWQGWLVTLGVVAFVIGNTIRVERGGYTDADILAHVFAPTIAAIILLIIICYRTGEPPKWQWGPPKSSNKQGEY